MSNPVQRGPGNDAFGGGALIRAAPPTSGPTGALPGANTSTPLGGVNPPSTPFFARPNSGTNIRIPYNRVVPLSDPRGGGLPAVTKSDSDPSSPEEWYTHMHADAQTKTHMSETDTLHATRIAFVLAKKSHDMLRFQKKDGGVSAQLGLDEREVTTILLDIVAATERHGVRLPREFGLLVKQALYFDRYTKLLAPELDVLSDDRIDLGTFAAGLDRNGGGAAGAGVGAARRVKPDDLGGGVIDV